MLTFDAPVVDLPRLLRQCRTEFPHAHLDDDVLVVPGDGGRFEVFATAGHDGFAAGVDVAVRVRLEEGAVADVPHGTWSVVGDWGAPLTVRYPDIVAHVRASIESFHTVAPVIRVESV